MSEEYYWFCYTTIIGFFSFFFSILFFKETLLFLIRLLQCSPPSQLVQIRKAISRSGPIPSPCSLSPLGPNGLLTHLLLMTRSFFFLPELNSQTWVMGLGHGVQKFLTERVGKRSQMDHGMPDAETRQAC